MGQSVRLARWGGTQRASGGTGGTAIPFFSASTRRVRCSTAMEEGVKSVLITTGRIVPLYSASSC